MKYLNRNKLSVLAAMVFLAGHCVMAPVMAEQTDLNMIKAVRMAELADFDMGKALRKELKNELRSNVKALYRKAQDFNVDSERTQPTSENTIPGFITRFADVFSLDNRGEKADDVASEAGKIN